MKIGVISEGHADRAVVSNILKGLIGIDLNDIEPLRPIYNLDETDKALINKQTYSTWSVIKEECENRELIDGFLAFEGQDFVVIHIDTAEADQYGIKRPDKKSENYCLELRGLVIEQIRSWLKDNIDDKILYAIAVEEIDAWILPIYEKRDSTKSIDPKEKLNYLLKRKGIKATSNYENFLLISEPLSKHREITKGNLLSYNCSLKAFFEEINLKVLVNKD